MHEVAKKDVKRAFGVLNKNGAIIVNPARAMFIDKINNMMYTCIILHNMIRKHRGHAISPDWHSEEQHGEDNRVRTREQTSEVIGQIKL